MASPISNVTLSCFTNNVLKKKARSQRKAFRKKKKRINENKVVIQNMIHRVSEIGVYNTSVHDLTKDKIPKEQLDTLALGHHFIKVPKPDPNVITNALKSFKRIVRLQWIHRDKKESYVPQWYIPKKSNPLPVIDDLENPMKTLGKNLCKSPSENPSLNWPRYLSIPLKLLLARKDVLVTLTDKNLGYAVVDIHWYNTAILSHLEDDTTYKEVTDTFLRVDQGKSASKALFEEMLLFIEEYKNFISDREIKWMSQKKDWAPIRFYILPKIHKKPYKSRPITPSMTWVTYHLSEWIAYELNPYMKASKIILRDSGDLVSNLVTYKVPTLTRKDLLDGQEIWLISADIEAMYPNINTDRGVAAIERFLEGRQYRPKERREFLLRALRFTLTSNYVIYKDRIFRQTNGTAMGTPAAPQYANLVMEELETDYITKAYKNGLLFYKRFIDDLFMIFKGTRSRAEGFIQGYNTLDPSIKLTSIISDTTIDFLDLTIYKGHIYDKCRNLDTKVFQKAMNQYLYLPHTSYHTMATKKGFIKGEAMRYARLTSSKALYQNLINTFTLRLQRRGYTLKFIHDSLRDVHWENRNEYLRVQTKQRGHIPLLFKIMLNPIYRKDHLREALNGISQEFLTVKGLPDSLQGKITICHKLPPKVHMDILKARKIKGL